MTTTQDSIRGDATTVVIPNWNGIAFLPVVLESLERQTVRPAETIVVDNGSTDGSVEYLRASWPSVTVIALEENKGFSGAINRGLEAAASTYVALVNNDLELDPTWIEVMEAGLSRHPRAGSAACKLLDFYDRSLFQEAGSFFCWDGTPQQRGAGERDIGQLDQDDNVFSACAGAALYRADALAKVGLFDETFFAYLEDVDWGFRSQRKGYSCVYLHEGRAYHMGSATATASKLPVAKLYLRNNFYLIAKNYSVIELLLFAPLYLTQFGRTFVGLARQGRGGEMTEAFRDFRLIFKAARQKRSVGLRAHARLAAGPTWRHRQR